MMRLTLIVVTSAWDSKCGVSGTHIDASAIATASNVVVIRFIAPDSQVAFKARLGNSYGVARNYPTEQYQTLSMAPVAISAGMPSLPPVEPRVCRVSRDGTRSRLALDKPSCGQYDNSDLFSRI